MNRQTRCFACAPRYLILIAAVISIAGLHSVVATAAELDLPTAEMLAVREDPSVQRFEAQSAALSERAISSAQLPDPKLKLGAAALPLDTFDLDQEPMTQLQLGVIQRFPPGDTLELRGRQLETRSQAMAELALDQQLITVRSVREDYLEAFYQNAARTILGESRSLFAELVSVTRDYYATGRTRQQDVYRAELELSRIDDRITQISQAEDMARARLAIWIAEAAYRPISVNWPKLRPVESLDTLVANLEAHPRLRAHKQDVVAAEFAVDSAREKYKPGWALDLTYGNRSGNNLDGSSRADFLTAMVFVDLPLFRGNRQDRELAASIKDVDASTAARMDTIRKMHRQADLQWAALIRLDERLQLFEQRLLPEASANSTAALEAFQSGVGDFTALMRAQITEYQLRLEHARARVDRLISQAHLIYLMGEEQ